jgi:hypothetical protein
MKIRIALAAALLVSGCSAKANDALLASELTWSQEKDGWSKSLEFSPWLAEHRDLVRRIRAERIAEMTGDEDGTCDAAADGSPTCQRSWTYTLRYSGKRLISLIAEGQLDTGGAHPTGGYSDYLFDVEADQKIRFGDLFTSWADIRPLLQRSFCAQLRERNAEYTCPPVEKQALALSGGAGKASSITVETQDYALGSYADGRETIYVPLAQDMLSLIKPEYRGEFTAAGN